MARPSEELTAHVEKRPVAIGDGMVETNRETKHEEVHDFSEGDFYQFEPDEAVITRQGKGWVHGRIRMLEESVR